MTAVDVFVVAGQSNALGRGDSALSPTVGAGEGYEVNGSTVSHLADPVGSANTGSAWPAFAIEYYNLTNRVPAIVSTAVGGTSLVAAADTGVGNWSSTGTVFSSSTSATTTALAALVTAGHTPTLRGVLWAQGETDALHPIAEATYQSALIDLHTRYQAALGTVPLFVCRLGDRAGGVAADWEAIRDAQDAAATATAGIDVVYTRAKDFTYIGWMADALHYTQAGYNDMGTRSARVVAELLGFHTPPLRLAHSFIVGADGNLTGRSPKVVA